MLPLPTGSGSGSRARQMPSPVFPRSVHPSSNPATLTVGDFPWDLGKFLDASAEVEFR